MALALAFGFAEQIYSAQIEHLYMSSGEWNVDSRFQEQLAGDGDHWLMVIRHKSDALKLTKPVANADIYFTHKLQ